MFFQPISNKPALFIPQFEALVLSDLHIGIENELREYGVYADSQIIQMESMIQEMYDEYKPKEIILLGDIKHSIPSTPFYEKKHLYEFLKRLQSYAKIHIIPGNHDGSINQHLNLGWDWVGWSMRIKKFGKVIQFSHKPIPSYNCDIQLHGHFHNNPSKYWEGHLKQVIDSKHRLLILEDVEYKPVDLEQLVG